MTTGNPSHHKKATMKKAMGVKSKNWMMCGLKCIKAA